MARPVHVALTAGQRHDSLKAEELLEHCSGNAFVADAQYDSNQIRAVLRARRIKSVINSNGMRKRRKRLDRALDQHRFKVECFFHRLKAFRAIATRYEKTARNFQALVELACAWIWIT